MPSPRRLRTIAPKDIDSSWTFLVERIGERRAGSDGEQRAAAYIAEQFARAGLANVHREPFSCNSLRSASARLETPSDGGWSKCPCEVLVGSPSTDPADHLTEMPLTWVEMPEQSNRLKSGSMQGRALCLFGPMPAEAASHRALARSGAQLVIWVDDRLPFAWPKADGIIPALIRSYGVVPTISVAYRTAYEWRARGIDRIRAAVRADYAQAISDNVVGELRGRDAGLGSIIIGCHHDTQANVTGADDNASGVVGVLALAKALATASRKRILARSLRFISFSAEEQLSVGSRAYVLANRPGPRSVALMVNLDSIASALGHNEVYVAGTKSLQQWAQGRMRHAGVPVNVHTELTPFADHFPFTAMGIPALWFYRPNFPGGRWQHHSVHDTLANSSAVAVCTLVNAIGDMIVRLADARTLPFEAGLPPQQAPLIRRMARELYDMEASR